MKTKTIVVIVLVILAVACVGWALTPGNHQAGFLAAIPLSIIWVMNQ